tara:strand:- start:3377 stop:3604 length:228 start_codon:yes stop_codon:yes gene_type:complete
MLHSNVVLDLNDIKWYDPKKDDARDIFNGIIEEQYPYDKPILTRTRNQLQKMLNDLDWKKVEQDVLELRTTKTNI